MANNNYTIDFVDDTKSSLEILANSEVGPSGMNKKTDIDLIGMGYSLWGEKILENLVHILENFSCEEDMHDILAIPSPLTLTIEGNVIKSFNNISSFITIEAVSSSTATFTIDGTNLPSYDSINDETTITIIGGDLTTVTLPAITGTQGRPNQSLFFSPTLPLQGQIWYNQTTGQINVWDGSWKRVGGMTISSIEPANPSDGDFWWDTSTSTTPSDAAYGRNLQIYLTVGGWQPVIQDYLPRDGSKAMVNNLNMGANKIENLADPDSADDAVNLGFADTRFVNITGDAMVADLSMGTTNTITDIADPINPADAVPFSYADNRYLNSSGDIMTGILNVNNNTIINVPNPVANQDAANKQWVEANFVNTVTFYPIGSVYITVDPLFVPATVFGGTWSKIAAGRMLIGQDGDLVEDTGGTANAVTVAHTHTTNSTGAHNHGIGTNILKSNYPSGPYNRPVDPISGSSPSGFRVSEANAPNHSHTANSSGVSGIGRNLPPYFVVIMWKRLI